MTEDEKTRLLGVRDGLVSGLLSVRSVIGSLTGPNGAYLPPKRFSRKLASVNNQIEVLRKVETIIQHQYNDVMEVYDKN